MARFVGKLKKVDLGAGAWVLETDDGERPLDGPVPEDLEGQDVVVEGKEASLFGFAMTGGKGIRVKRVSAAE